MKRSVRGKERTGRKKINRTKNRKRRR